MKGHFREFTKAEVRAAFEEGRFEELATCGLENGSIEWAAEQCMPCLQRHFNDLIEEGEEADYDEIDQLMNERAIELFGKPIFGPIEPDLPLIVEGFEIDQVGDLSLMLEQDCFAELYLSLAFNRLNKPCRGSRFRSVQIAGA